MIKNRKKKTEVERPEIFRYHDYQLFIKDWLAYRKASQPGFSLRKLADQADLATGYLSMVQSGKRSLTAKALVKLSSFLGLTDSEYSFLESLLVLGTTDSQPARLAALEKMGRFQLYRKHNPGETEAYKYLTHWHYVAIREMAALPGFNLDPFWIQSRLHASVPLKEIKEAVEFLLKNGYLETAADGSVRPPEKSLDCQGGVYRVALTQFHREIFELAGKAIESVPSTAREIQGHTLGLSSENYEQARAIVDEAIRQIRALGEAEKNTDSIYHMQVALFPLTQRRAPK